MQPSSSRHALSGMRAFTVIWIGQFLSLLGSGVTRFAITLWAWELTGQATTLALAAVFSFAPAIIMTPIAGALVDLWHKQRKLVMMLSDFSAALAAGVLLLLAASDSLAIWHLYAAGAFASAFEAFQWPAYSAAITTMVDKTQYGRTSAMLSLAESASGILAPIFGAGLYIALRLEGVLLLDLLTFAFAVGALLIVHIPDIPAPSTPATSIRSSLLTETLYGFRYIVARPSLLGLQLVFFFGNLTASFSGVLLAPMILARTNNNESILSLVLAVQGVGAVAGGLAMSVWGGPARRVNGVLLGWLLSSLLGTVVLGLGQSPAVWVLGAVGSSLFVTLINASNQAIWQTKIAPAEQGRVFAARALIARVAAPFAMLVAGPLADFVFEPGMQPGGTLAGAFGGLVGVGAGAGMALMFVISGLLCSLVGIVGYLVRVVREVEQIIPDHTLAAAPAVQTTP